MYVRYLHIAGVSGDVQACNTERIQDGKITAEETGGEDKWNPGTVSSCPTSI